MALKNNKNFLKKCLTQVFRYATIPIIVVGIVGYDYRRQQLERQ
jgi:hypothetical protein